LTKPSGRRILSESTASDNFSSVSSVTSSISGFCVKIDDKHDCDGNYNGPILIESPYTPFAVEPPVCGNDEIIYYNICQPYSCLDDIKRIPFSGLKIATAINGNKLDVSITNDNNFLDSPGCVNVMLYQTVGNLKDKTRLNLDA